MLRRLGVIFAALAASLAFAASAQAAPTKPGLKPIPYWVCGSSLPISWSPSTPDLFGTIVGYRVDIGDLTTGTSSAKFTSALGTTLTGLVNGHHYVVRVRALQKRFGVYTYSTSAADTFKRLCLQIPDKIISQYVEYNPWPECIRCGGLDYVHFDDPVIYRALEDVALPQERFEGLKLDEQGGIIIIGG
jgi:hypothetical protein